MTQFHSIRRMRICSECDLVVALPPLPPGTQAFCPRCQHTLARRQRQPVQRVTAWSLAALMLLVLALYFDFVSFSTRGVGETITLTDTVLAMLNRGEAWLAVVLTLTMVILPACYLLGLIYLHVTVVLGGKWPGPTVDVEMGQFGSAVADGRCVLNWCTGKSGKSFIIS